MTGSLTTPRIAHGLSTNHSLTTRRIGRTV
jgi:hypothetical protein